MYPLVHIIWNDAASPSSGWMPSEVFKEQCGIMEAHTLGFLVAEDKTQYKVCQSYFPKEGDMSCGIAIPKKWVKQIKRLPDPSGTTRKSNRRGTK